MIPDDADQELPWFAEKAYRVHVRAPSGEDVKVARVTCGAESTYVISSRGDLYVCGSNSHSQLGLGVAGPRCVWTPEYLPISRPGSAEAEFVLQVAAGSHHAIACCLSGVLFVWGEGSKGRLGLKSHTSQHSPMMLTLPDGRQAVFVACGDEHSAAIDRDGALFTWGSGTAGKLGHGDENHALRPLRVAHLESESVLTVACGAAHTIALTHGGAVYAWGGGLCVARGASVSYPTPIPSLVSDIVEIASGPAHCLCMTKDGDVISWGRGDRYRLGHDIEADEVSISIHTCVCTH